VSGSVSQQTHGPGLRLSVRLSGRELLARWETFELGVPPALLPLFSPARSHQEHRRWMSEAMSALGRRNLVQGGRPCLGLAEALRLLARPEYLLDLRCGAGPDRMLLGLGAVAGERGVTVVSDGSPQGPFELLTMDSVRIAGSLLELLGPIHAGVGRPVNIPADQLDQARAEAHRDLWRMADSLQQQGVPRIDVTALVRMVTGIRAGGQLGVTIAERRASWVVGFHAAEAGWFLQLRRPRVS
jgi:hypothetical protein